MATRRFLGSRRADRTAESAPPSEGAVVPLRIESTYGSPPDTLTTPEDVRTEKSIPISSREIRLYGVAQGFGSHEGDIAAACIAAFDFTAHVGRAQAHTGIAERNLIEAVNSTHADIKNGMSSSPEHDGMSAHIAAVQVVEQPDGKYASWVAIGNAEIYVSTDPSNEEEIKKLTKKEPKNCLGGTKGSYKGVQQYGSFKLVPGMRILICTDNITAKGRSKSLPLAEIGAALKGWGQDEALSKLFSLSGAKETGLAHIIDVFEDSVDIASPSPEASGGTATPSSKADTEANTFEVSQLREKLAAGTRVARQVLERAGVDVDATLDSVKGRIHYGQNRAIGFYAEHTSENIQVKVSRTYEEAKKMHERYGPTVKKVASQAIQFADNSTRELRKEAKAKAKGFYEDNRSQVLIGAASVVGAAVLGKSIKRAAKKSRKK